MATTKKTAAKKAAKKTAKVTKQTIMKSAVDGEIVTPEYAEHHPATTYKTAGREIPAKKSPKKAVKKATAFAKSVTIKVKDFPTAFEDREKALAVKKSVTKTTVPKGISKDTVISSKTSQNSSAPSGLTPVQEAARVLTGREGPATY